MEVCDPCRLSLVDEVGVPFLGADGIAEGGLDFCVHEIRPDNGDSGEAGHDWNLRMDFDFSVVLAEFKLLLRAKVLVSKENYASLSDEQCEFVSLGIGEILQLQANDLRSNVGREVNDLLCSTEERLLAWICSGTSIYKVSVVVSQSKDILQVERYGWTILGVVSASCEVKCSLIAMRVLCVQHTAQMTGDPCVGPRVRQDVLQEQLLR